VTHPRGEADAFGTMPVLSHGDGLSLGSYWTLGGLFTAAYVLIERITFVYQLDGLGITLWSPSAGLSVIFLLLTGTRFAPFVFVASVITDYVVYTGPRGLFAPICTSLVLMIGFAGVAVALTSTLRAHRLTLSRVLILLGVVSGTVFVMAIAYSMVLYACDLLTFDRWGVAIRNFWIGDTLGIITLLPAALTALDGRARRYALSRTDVTDALVFGVLLVMALWIIFGVRRSHEYQFFYFLFIPVVYIAVRTGYAGVSLALPVVHVLIVSIAMAFSYAVYDFIAFQMLMLVLSASGLLLGVAVSEARTSAERVRAQEGELARAARHALVGATGAALAHEISQPLASTTNYLHAARRLLSSGADRFEAVQALAKAESEAQRLRETLERVRDYVSSGRLELSDVDVAGVARKIADVMGRDADAGGVRIEVASRPHLPLVRGDAIQLEQLLLNLMANAVDAAGTDANAGRVTVGVAQLADRLLVTVEDNGPGVAPRVADRLFEPFETTKRNGMGLGLTLARQIVEAHGGQLTWENSVSGGARFTVDVRIDGPRGS
jgi:two-component system, LuxR family, sensor kinase FixL